MQENNITNSTEDKPDLSERDVFVACCGQDEERESKALAAIRMVYLDLMTGSEEELADEIVLEEPVINICRSVKFTMVDLTFMPNSFNLVNVVARMQEFIKAQDAATKPDNIVPSIMLTVTPKDFDAVAYCTGSHGAWYVMPSKVGRPVDTIRFIYSNELFGVFIADEGKIYEEDAENFEQETA